VKPDRARPWIVVVRIIIMTAIVVTCQRESGHMEADPYPPFLDPHWIMPSPAPPELGVTLSCDMYLSGDVLSVTYWIENRTRDRYVVFNRLTVGTTWGADAVRVDLAGSGLVLSKQVMPRPEYFRDLEEVPLQSVLEPGGTVWERFSVPLPATVNNYVRHIWLEQRSRFTKEYNATARRKTDRVTLIIGILRVPSHARLDRSWQGPDVYGIDGVDVEREQMVLSKTVILPRAVEVLDYEEQPATRTP